MPSGGKVDATIVAVDIVSCGTWVDAIGRNIRIAMGCLGNIVQGSIPCLGNKIYKGVGNDDKTFYRLYKI